MLPKKSDIITNARDDASQHLAAVASIAGRNVAASLRSISKSFKGTTVLEDINFDVTEGESLVLLGASGSGKTTILRIIAGLEEPDTGRVILRGTDVTETPARERGIGVIFQSYALFPRMTVEQNIGYGLRIRARPRGKSKQQLIALSRLFIWKNTARNILHSFPAGNSSALQLRAHSPTNRRCCFLTNPSARSMPERAFACAGKSACC